MGADKQDPRIRRILNELVVEIDDTETNYSVTLKGSDTGLIGKDSSPTMPGISNIMDKILSKLK